MEQFRNSPFRIHNRINLLQDIPLPQTSKTTQSILYMPVAKFRQLETLRQQVISLKNNKRYHEALRRIQKIIKQHPKDIRNYQIKGQINYELKMYQQALNCYNKLIGFIHDSENIPTSIKYDIFAQNETNENQQSKRLASLYYFNQGLCYQKLLKHSQAIQSFKMSVSMGKNKKDGLICLATSYYYLGNKQKTYKIFQKVTTNSLNLVQISQIISICLQDQKYQLILLLTDRLLKNEKDKRNIEFLLIAKGDALKKLMRFSQSIGVYTKLQKQLTSTSQLYGIYVKIAQCMDKDNKKQEALLYYNRAYSFDQSNLQIINNIANLNIRIGKYNQALQFINNGLKLMVKASQNQMNLLKQLILRSHRIVVHVKLGKINQACQDFKLIISRINENKIMDIECLSELTNYKFIKGVIQKYKQMFVKMEQINFSIHQSPIPHAIKNLQKQMVESIVQQLDNKKSSFNLQNLAHRIDKLYEQIVLFKHKTLKIHQQNTNKVHQKIIQIQQKLAVKSKQTERMEQQLAQIKNNYSTIYQLVDQQIKNASKIGDFTRKILQLKDNDKGLVALYLQQLYWVFNAYFVSIRLVSNHLVVQGQNNLHLNKISIFFTKFKKVFQIVSHLPQMGTICESISALISFYLEQQSSIVFQNLNQILTNVYTTQKQLQQHLQTAILSLLDSQYIQQSIANIKRNKVVKQMKFHNKAINWFEKQKHKITSKIFGVQTNKCKDQQLIRDLVMEDVSAIMVCLIKNKSSILKKKEYKNRNVLKTVFTQTLVMGQKNNQIMSLYSRESCKDIKNQGRQGCGRCSIYLCTLQYQVLPAQQNQKKQAMKDLIQQGIKQRNWNLVGYVLSQLLAI